MNDLKSDIAAHSEALFAHTQHNRRHLHLHPELSFQEHETGHWIAQQLKTIGIPHQHGIAENGVVAHIEGQRPDSAVVALRADFDALPIQELTGLSFESEAPGVMHACGHDAHTASLLSCARLLFDTRHRWNGTVKLVFQPAEEKLPGGAKLMIEQGVLRNPTPHSMIGQHVAPNVEVGKVGFKSGIYMASTDELYLKVEGRGGHGAMPHTSIDPVAISAQIIVAAQQLISRMADPTLPSVLTFGKIWSEGGATNIIPDNVRMEGTLRVMDEKWRQLAHEKLTRLIQGIADSFGAKAELQILKGYPVLINDTQVTERCRAAAIAFLGKDRVIELPLRMTAEDFAYYAQAVPSCFYRLGTGNKAYQNSVEGLHSPRFDIDESSLRFSPGLMAWLALNELSAQ